MVRTTQLALAVDIDDNRNQAGLIVDILLSGSAKNRFMSLGKLIRKNTKIIGGTIMPGNRGSLPQGFVG